MNTTIEHSQEVTRNYYMDGIGVVHSISEDFLAPSDFTNLFHEDIDKCIDICWKSYRKEFGFGPNSIRDCASLDNSLTFSKAASSEFEKVQSFTRDGGIFTSGPSTPFSKENPLQEPLDMAIYWNSLGSLKFPATNVTSQKAKMILVCAPRCEYRRITQTDNYDEAIDWIARWNLLHPGLLLHHFDPYTLQRFMASIGYYAIDVDVDGIVDLDFFFGIYRKR